jgi:hypothetical protein
MTTSGLPGADDESSQGRVVGMGHQLSDAPRDNHLLPCHPVLASDRLPLAGGRLTAQNLVIAGKRIRIVMSLQNQEVEADR